MTMQKCGSLCFWGDWSGRPMDNWHIPVSADCDRRQDVLTICFDGGERCTIYAPKGIVNEPKTFRVRSAGKVVWEWYCCCKGQTPGYLYRRVYTWNEGKPDLAEYRGEQIIKQKRINWQGEPAVEIC